MIRVKKADLLAVAHCLIGHLSYSQVPALAKRHKVEAKKDSASAQELLVKKVGACDEAELCKLLLESACWIRRISDPPPAATTFSWMPPNATEWIRRSRKRPWQRNLLRNEKKRRRREASRRTARRLYRSIPLSFRRSASLHSAIFLGSEAGAAVSTVYNSDR